MQPRFLPGRLGLLGHLSPERWQARNVTQADRLLRLAERSRHLAQRHAMIGPRQHRHCVTRADVAFLYHAEVGAHAQRCEEALEEARIPDTDAELVAWQSRLRHFEHRRSELPSLADHGGREVDPFGGEVLAEEARL